MASRKSEIPSDPRNLYQEMIQEDINREIAAGRHSHIEAWRTVCGGCRRWVAGIWYVTPERVGLCRACAPAERK
jgi:hypothetical protein